MTTPPKARKFNIRRSLPALPAAVQSHAARSAAQAAAPAQPEGTASALAAAEAAPLRSPAPRAQPEPAATAVAAPAAPAAGQSGAPQSAAPQSAAPQSAAPQSAAPQSAASQSAASQSGALKLGAPQSGTPLPATVPPNPASRAARQALLPEIAPEDERPAGAHIARAVRPPPLPDTGLGLPELSDPLLDAEDGFGAEPFPTAAAARPRAPRSPSLAAQEPTVLGPAEMTAEEEIEAIRREGLTGRQLRMARRVAQKHGIQATSDFEAVRLLRRRGIDPFQRSNNLLDLVVADPAEPAAPRVQLPQTVRQAPPPALPDATPRAVPSGAEREREIMQIQQDIARRRRRKLALLFVRLAFFVLLPTLVAGWYYFFVATPLYSTRSEFVIQQADTQVAGLGSIFSGTQFATSQDSITVQGYLQSREAMLRLDRDLGFRAHWSKPGIDPIQRLAPDATIEQAYGLYKRNVRISYDPTEGVIKMEVIATDPETSAAFSKALIGYAEEQVDHLTQRLREDQMKGARESYQDAEQKVLDAQSKVLTLQEQLGVLDPVSENGVVMGQVSTFEVQLAQKRLELGQLMDNAQPNAARVAGVQGDIARLQKLIADLRATLTESTSGSASLAAVTGELRIAESELQTRQVLLSAAAQQMETARIEANKQVRYLSTGVRPIAPDQPTYPRAFENTLVAMMIFAGIYLMMSLTASILREQVSA